MRNPRLFGARERGGHPAPSQGAFAQKAGFEVLQTAFDPVACGSGGVHASATRVIESARPVVSSISTTAPCSFTGPPAMGKRMGRR